MRIITPLLQTIRRSMRPVQVEPPPTARIPTEDERRRATELADAIDTALDRGQLAQAERLALSADRLIAHAPRLVEPIARLRLAQGEPMLALDLLEQYGVSREGRRLLRVLCLLQLGRRDDAHSELLRWSRRSSAPLSARRLLALLEWSTGDDQSAMQLLLRNLRHLEDPTTLSYLLALSVSGDRSELAERWAERLRQEQITRPHDPNLTLLLDALDQHVSELNWPKASEAQVEHLAQELVVHPAVIPALVSACELKHTPVARLDLLVRAIEGAKRDIRESADVDTALGTLRQIIENRNAARTWTPAELHDIDDLDDRYDLDDDAESHPAVLATILPAIVPTPSQERAA